MKKIILAGALACAFTSTFAEELPVFDLGTLVVTPIRFASPSHQSSSNVTVITARDIQASGARTIPELLATQAGIRVHSTDGTPDSSIDLRGFGMTGNQNTLVLLDGQRLNDIDLSSVRWSMIPLDSIARIEIIRGSGSVLYGQGASGGTINIITQTAAKTSTGRAQVAIGSYGGQDIQASAELVGEGVSARISADGYDSNGYRRNNDNRQRTLLGNLRADLPNGHIDLRFGLDSQDVRYPGVRTVAPTTGLDQLSNDRRGTATPNDYGTREGNQIGLSYNRRIGNVEITVDAGHREKYTTADFVSSTSYLQTDLGVNSFSPRLKFNHRLFGQSADLVAGADLDNWRYHQVRATAPSTIGTPSADIRGTQHSRGFYLHEAIQWSDTTVSLGARTQHVEYQANDAASTASYASASQSRTVNAYDLGARHKLSPEWAIFGKIGRSFRIATVDEIYNQYGGPTFDAIVTMLEPQTSNDREIGADYSWHSGKVRATAYHMDLKNELHYNALTFTNMNLSPTRRYGMELEANWQANPAWSFSGNYTYTVAQFRSGIYSGTDVSGNTLPVVPTHSAAVSAHWEFAPRASWNTSLRYVGTQYFDNDQQNNFAHKIPAYRIVDMNLMYSLDKNWTLSATANNLFNEKYFTYGIRSASTPGRFNAYPMPERNYWLSAAYAFK